MNGWIKWLVIGSFILFLLPNRYRILNLLLGNFLIRRFAVQGAMSIPAIRSKFIQSTFR
ncbi:hypothetical protein GA0061094_1138 [[Bacillus] enclensis]|jgi:hypothetical protein|uniref:Uncharacterized protein n=2 Tax=Rossellomorea TaxID=2837508 RepID=A0A1C4A0V0_9BACI|nr:MULTISPECIES: hypothetical protein [Rossellomorea]MBH9967444.1 hypothetical protein [[Bacillus] enclensis]QTC43498.1 hypothetical protein I7V34_09795 [Bacillus sp. V3]QWC21670.1 hypothetical protein KJK41_15260 [Bacillus haikouensis]SCB88165.1 hypothetical protein GA0061094_1138 [[Bacillus] enclensis]